MKRNKSQYVNKGSKKYSSGWSNESIFGWNLWWGQGEVVEIYFNI